MLSPAGKCWVPWYLAQSAVESRIVPGHAQRGRVGGITDFSCHDVPDVYIE